MSSTDENQIPAETEEKQPMNGESTEQVDQSQKEASPPAKKMKIEEKPNHKQPPVHGMVGGSSVRQYLNKHVTEHLLEGLKQIGKEKPEDPLKSLGEFLIRRSDEVNQKEEV